MMHKIGLLAILLLVFTDSLVAQFRFFKRKRNNEDLIIPARSVLLRFNMAGLLDPVETNFSVGSEYLLRQKTSVALDVGLITFSRSTQGIEKSSGFLIRPSFRNYLGKQNKWYAEVELHLKNVRLEIYDWLGKNCVNNIPAYEQLQNFVLRKSSKGVHAKIGTQFTLDKQQKLLMDWYLGGGVRITKFSLKDEPNHCYSVRQLFTSFQAPGDEFFPVVVFGFRLAYRIR
jgi:hypothetical protein